MRIKNYSQWQPLDYVTQEKILKHNSKWLKKGKETVELSACECEEFDKYKTLISEDIFNKIKNLLC